MISTQYRITLPSDYDMNIIKERVRSNGHKTDGFTGLNFKLYLITEKGVNNSFQNSYAPLYLWNTTQGLNKFLLTGYYDNIITSFGWQQVNLGIPIVNTITSRITGAKHVLAISQTIPPQSSLKDLSSTIDNEIPKIDDAERLIIYTPEKWEYTAYYLTDTIPRIPGLNSTIYNILHISTAQTL